MKEMVKYCFVKTILFVNYYMPMKEQTQDKFLVAKGLVDLL